MKNMHIHQRLLSLATWLLVTVLSVACKPSQGQKQAQGICGTVVFKSGNHMPGPGRSQPKGQPVVREVLVYELTKIDQTQTTDDGFYARVNTRLIKKVQSDKDGKFCVDLAPGTYSIFVQEQKGLYANLFDTQNHIFPVTVEKNRQSSITFEITYQAVY